MPAISVLAGMEVSGVVFLPERVTRFSVALQQHLESVERTAVTAVGGREFNLASPDQVWGAGSGLNTWLSGCMKRCRTVLGCPFELVFFTCVPCAAFNGQHCPTPCVLAFRARTA